MLHTEFSTGLFKQKQELYVTTMTSQMVLVEQACKDVSGGADCQAPNQKYNNNIAPTQKIIEQGLNRQVAILDPSVQQYTFLQCTNNYMKDALNLYF